LHDRKEHSEREDSHGEQLYYKKFLTTFTLCTTVSDMANVLNKDKQIAHQAYAWVHDGERPKESSVAVLHIAPITSAAAAVSAALIQEFRSLESEES
jgi:hypothetical protein